MRKADLGKESIYVEKDRAMYKNIEEHNNTTSLSYAYKSLHISLDFDGHSQSFKHRYTSRYTQIPRSNCLKRVEEYLLVS